nr:molybdopterin-dependent oxidoreductase [Desulfobacula sp.]
MDTHITPTICRICKENCGVLVRQAHEGDLRIMGNPDHPLSKGFICFRGQQFSDIRNHPERLSKPLLRQKGGWKPIPYEDAMDIMAEKFNRCRKMYGAQSVAFLKGEALKHQEIRGYMKHLAHAFGSPNYMSVGSLCHQSLAMGHGLTYGGIPKPDFQKIKSAVLWGTNVAVSSPRLFSRIRKAVKKGLKLVVVDP